MALTVNTEREEKIVGVIAHDLALSSHPHRRAAGRRRAPRLSASGLHVIAQGSGGVLVQDCTSPCQHHAVVAAGALRGDVTVEHVLQHGGGLPFQGIAPASATGGLAGVGFLVSQGLVAEEAREPSLTTPTTQTPGYGAVAVLVL